jgi:uncharacterized membrane protein
MGIIRNIIEFFWPMLPPQGAPQHFPEARENEVRAQGEGLRSICGMAEKAYQEEYDRMRVIESKASIFIGTTTFMATFVIGISTFLAKEQNIGLFLMILAILACCICIYMARVLYLSIRALERSAVAVVNPVKYYNLNNHEDILVKIICEYINATHFNHTPINRKMDFVVLAQQYFKRVLYLLGVYGLVLLSLSAKHYSETSHQAIYHTLKMIDDFHPEPWLLLLLFGFSAVAIVVVILGCCSGMKDAVGEGGIK